MNWLQLENPDTIRSPALIVDADRVGQNVDRMIQMVGGPRSVNRLRPHVKTHKMPAVIQMQMDAGIDKFKAATLSEAAMVAGVGPADVLIAYQPVGPNVEALSGLVERFPDSSFSAITDDIAVARRIARQFRAEPLRGRAEFPLWIDVDCGMHRTGVELGDKLDRLRDAIESEPGVSFCGLHVYDGHIHDPSAETRQATARAIIDSVRRYEVDHPCPAVVGGGSPTFATWAEQTEWQCSPGTPLFWDIGYGDDHPEMRFEVAAALLTRVISKPGENRLCLDLGYKAVASEKPLEGRLRIPAIADATMVSQSEEHLVVTTSAADRIEIGDSFLAYPRHICPTVALHAVATVVRGGRASGETWKVTARDRLLPV